MNNIDIERRMRSATITLCMMRSKSAVKDAIRRQGTRKLSQAPSAEITAMAKVFFAQHHERLIADAIPVIEQWLATGFFGRKAQLEWLANIESNAQSQGPCSNKTISVQDLCANWRAQR